MANIIIIINQLRKDYPVRFWLTFIITTLIAIGGLRLAYLSYSEKHTPKLEVAKTSFYYQPFPGGNITGILIEIVNQSDAWAKNVNIDFINDNGYSKYEKVKYYRENDFILEPLEIAPHSGVMEGYLPQGAGGSPTIYQNGEKDYKVDIFISWENDRGKKYSLVSQYATVSDKFGKQIRFKRLYKYDTFKDKRKVEEIKRANKAYLPSDLL